MLSKLIRMIANFFFPAPKEAPRQDDFVIVKSAPAHAPAGVPAMKPADGHGVPEAPVTGPAEVRGPITAAAEPSDGPDSDPAAAAEDGGASAPGVGMAAAQNADVVEAQAPEVSEAPDASAVIVPDADAEILAETQVEARPEPAPVTGQAPAATEAPDTPDQAGSDAGEPQEAALAETAPEEAPQADHTVEEPAEEPRAAEEPAQAPAKRSRKARVPKPKADAAAKPARKPRGAKAAADGVAPGPARKPRVKRTEAVDAPVAASMVPAEASKPARIRRKPSIEGLRDALGGIKQVTFSTDDTGKVGVLVAKGADHIRDALISFGAESLGETKAGKSKLIFRKLPTLTSIRKISQL